MLYICKCHIRTYKKNIYIVESKHRKSIWMEIIMFHSSPSRESKLTQLLKEAMSSLTCRVAMIAHISSQPSHYSEILGTIQLASRVHRMRRKKIKVSNHNCYSWNSAIKLMIFNVTSLVCSILHRFSLFFTKCF